MRTLGQLAALALALFLAFAAPAAADQMTGTYVGTGISEGTTLNLTHEGFNISGDFSGVLNGTFYGQTDGGDYAEGFLTESGTTYTYYLNWTPTQLTITIYDTSGNQLAYAFVPQGGPTTPTTTTTIARPGTNTTPATTTQNPELSFHVYAGGVQSGPFTLEEMIGKVQSGEIQPDTLVWLAGTPEWVPAENINLLAEAFPPPPPQALTYYAVIGGQQAGPFNTDEVMAEIGAGRIGQKTLMWTTGMADWAAAETFEEFAEALVPPLPPLPPTPPPVTPPPMPNTPPAPPTIDTSALDPGSIERIIRKYAPNLGNDEQVLASVRCFMSLFEPLTVEQQRALIDTEFNIAPEMRDAILAEHPDYDEKGEVCADMASASTATPTTPGETFVDPGALEAMVMRRLDSSIAGVPQETVDLTVECLMGIVLSLTVDEQAEMLAVDGIMPPEMGERFEAAHPGMNKGSEDCVAMLQQASTPTTPATPQTPTTPAVDRAALETMIRNYMGVRIAGYTPPEMDTLVDCLTAVFASFTPAEQQIMLDTNGQPSTAEEDALEAAHPGYKQQKQDCQFPKPKPTTPAVAGGEQGTPGTADGGDPLTTVVRDYFSRMGLSGPSLDAAVGCTMTGYAVLTAEERQILVDSHLIPSPSQMMAIQTAHPDMEKGVQACFDTAVN